MVGKFRLYSLCWRDEREGLWSRKKEVDGTEHPQGMTIFWSWLCFLKALCTISVYIILTGTYGLISRKRKEKNPLKFLILRKFIHSSWGSLSFFR